MKRLTTILICSSLFFGMSYAQKKLPYKDASLPISQRIDDLIQRMTLEEKVGQLRCTLAWDYYTIQGKNVVPSEKFKKDIREGNIGMLWATYRADPWTQKSLENGLTPELAAKAGNALQRYVIENTRLGIPLFLAEEAPHGHMAIGATVFPTGIGMAATWSPQLIEQVGEIIGKEIRLQGGHISYGPVLDLARDPRWSRVEETFGEDPVLTAEIGAAMVRGTGGGALNHPHTTLATLKHFIAYGTTESGQNGAPSFIGQRELLENFLPPFRKAIDAGALSVMTSYNSMDGIPCTANGYLLNDILRGEWNFRGFVVSDLYSIDVMHNNYHVTHSLQEAGIQSLQAGVDADLGANAYALLVDAVRKNIIDERTIDTAVRRILQMKFEMGLFENPYVEPKKAAKEVGSEQAKKVALDVARASITLLKNENQTLPLSKNIKVALIGPNADNIYNMLGDYTAPQPMQKVKTILDGIRTKIGTTNVTYIKGCAVRDTTQSQIEAAVKAAQKCDVTVVCVGGSSARDFKTSYKETGAAVTDANTISDMDCGEGFDRATLALLGHQNRLLEAIKQTGKPLIVVYIEGRPLEKNWAATNSDALLTAYYPGQEGGTAIADVLFGDYNPAGRLPVSVPASVGQIPVYYNKKAPLPHDYVEMTAKPLYPFGYGLSYTTFEYSNLQIVPNDKQFNVSCTVNNSGNYDGDEVVQLYLHDDIASTVQPIKQLKRFKRIHLARGETQTVTFQLTTDDLAIIGKDMKPIVEPGTFTIMVGTSSEDIRLTGTLKVEN